MGSSHRLRPRWSCCSRHRVGFFEHPLNWSRFVQHTLHWTRLQHPRHHWCLRIKHHCRTTAHNSSMANKLDPRVDSTTGTTGTTGYSGTHAGNHSGTHTGTHGGISNSTNAGPHESNLANKADPRVDSDLDGKGNRHGANTGGVFGASGSHATAGSGTAQNTAGPHNSDMMNKIDPRVDSDRDGSKTYGGNATHQ